LWRLGYREAVPALLEVYVEPDGVIRKANALQALGKLGDEKLVPLFMKSLKAENSWGIRAMALKYLPEFGDVRVIPELIRLMHDTAWDTTISYGKREINALNLLMLKISSFRFEEVTAEDRQFLTPFLLKCLEDEKPRVKRVAIRLLGDLRAKEATAPICKLLASNDAELLTSVNNPLGVGASFALAKIQDASAYDTLKETLKHQNKRIAVAAARALAELGYRDGLAVALEGLKHPPVREQSAYVLGVLRAEEAIPQLTELLEDKRRAVRRAAQEALQQITGNR